MQFTGSLFLFPLLRAQVLALPPFGRDYAKSLGFRPSLVPGRSPCSLTLRTPSACSPKPEPAATGLLLRFAPLRLALLQFAAFPLFRLVALRLITLRFATRCFTLLRWFHVLICLCLSLLCFPFLRCPGLQAPWASICIDVRAFVRVSF